MKKMTFALACASAVAAFAAAQDSDSVISSIGFEDYTLTGDPLSFTGLSGKTDAGVSGSATDSFWLYDGGTSGAADGSAVKKYGTPNLDAPTTGAAAGEKYLELSTEGGTLWRSINHLVDSETLGAAQQVDAETGLYIDTMVQFTPTEDGGTPDLGEDDKLAIWLNVKDNVTNLCVQALQAKSEFSANVPQTFVLNNAAGNLTINAGEWYRLKVKVNRLMDVMTAYEIFIGNDQLKAVGDELPWDASSAALFAESPFKDQIAANQLFVSLQGMEEKAPALTAVGFKGSGAIDSLQFTTQDPGGVDPAGEFNVNWGSEGVQEVWGSTPPTDTELAAIQAWASANGLDATAVAGETGAAAYLLGLTAVPKEVPALKITAITQTETGWTITIACDAQPDLTKINGSLVVKTATTLGGTWTSQTIEPAFVAGKATITVSAGDAKFMKAAVTK